MDAKDNHMPEVQELVAIETNEEKPMKKRRGFAAMDPEKVREIAHRGGLAVHAKGTAHRFTREEAIEAGRKGGVARHVVRGRKRAAAA
jgi:general stress protein YciG